MSGSIGASDTPVYQCRNDLQCLWPMPQFPLGSKRSAALTPPSVASQPWQAAGFVLMNKQDLDQNLYSLLLLCHQPTNELINQ